MSKPRPAGAVGFLLQEGRALYGAERATLSLLRGLVARGINVCVLLMHETRLGQGAGPLEAAVRNAGWPLFRFDVAGPFSWKLARNVRDVVHGENLRVLHVTGYKAHLHAALARACPIVTAVHGWLFRPDAKERFYGWLDLRLMRRDAAVICLSRFYEDYLRRKGVPPARLRRIPTGLDPADLPPPAEARVTRPPDGRWTLGILGRLSWEKNHDLLLRTVARLRASGSDVRLLVAGDGPERGRVAGRVAELGLGGVVELKGYVDSASFFREIQILVLCSTIENLPCSILEAMAWGRPVVATRVGGIPDLVDDGRTGLLVERDDEAALAAALRSLMDQPALAQAMGAAGRARVEHEFLLDRQLDAHVRLYAEVGA